MTTERYTTVAGEGVSSFERRGSEFVGYAERVTTVEDAEGFVEDARNEHPDATHHVYAYRIHDDPVRERYDGDGEPSGSAGKPVLNVLQGEDIEDVIVVVVRYYGGTKLGYGGLVSAYSDAAKAAIDDARTTETVPRDEVRVEVEYDDSGTVRSVLESEGVEYDAEYGESAVFLVRPAAKESDDIKDRLLSATSGRARID